MGRISRKAMTFGEERTRKHGGVVFEMSTSEGMEDSNDDSDGLDGFVGTEDGDG